MRCALNTVVFRPTRPPASHGFWGNVPPIPPLDRPLNFPQRLCPMLTVCDGAQPLLARSQNIYLEEAWCRAALCYMYVHDFNPAADV